MSTPTVVAASHPLTTTSAVRVQVMTDTVDLHVENLRLVANRTLGRSEELLSRVVNRGVPGLTPPTPRTYDTITGQDIDPGHMSHHDRLVHDIRNLGDADLRDTLLPTYLWLRCRLLTHLTTAGALRDTISKETYRGGSIEFGKISMPPALDRAGLRSPESPLNSILSADTAPLLGTGLIPDRLSRTGALLTGVGQLHMIRHSAFLIHGHTPADPYRAGVTATDRRLTAGRVRWELENFNDDVRGFHVDLLIHLLTGVRAARIDNVLRG